MTPPNRPTLPPRQLLLIYFCAALCLIAVAPEHQLTPFAIIGQLVVLAIVGRFRGRGLVRSVFLIPYVLPSFVTATIWRTLLQPNGAVNSSLGWFGVDGGQWLVGERSFWTLVLVDTALSTLIWDPKTNGWTTAASAATGVVSTTTSVMRAVVRVKSFTERNPVAVLKREFLKLDERRLSEGAARPDFFPAYRG